MLTELWEATAFGNGDDLASAMADRYVEMTEIGGSALARSISLLAGDAPLPAVFHCAAGKDRTGVLGALVLRLLGVADADIVDDYALANRPWTPSRHGLWRTARVGRDVPCGSGRGIGHDQSPA